MESLTKDILKHLKNEHTKAELKEDFKGNYYSYITDTIYIAKNFEDKKELPKGKKINKTAANLIVICHECIHSVQCKSLHIINMILSNLSIVLSIIAVISGLFWTSPIWFKIPTIAIIIASIVARLILEIGAINGSIKLALDIISKGMAEGVLNEDIQEGASFIEKHKYLEFVRMVIDKIIFLILVLVI